MAQTQEKPAKTGDTDLGQSYAWLAGAGALLALGTAALPGSVARFISGPFGVFENLTVVMYLLALWITGGLLWKHRGDLFKNWKSYEKLVLLTVLTLVLIGEEIQWAIPWLYKDEFHAWPFISLQGLLGLAYAGVPEEASLKVIAAIAGLRLGSVLLVIYGFIALALYRSKLPALAARTKKPGFRWALGFVVLSLGAALMHAGIIPGRELFEEYAEMIAAGAFLAGVYAARKF